MTPHATFRALHSHARKAVYEGAGSAASLYGNAYILARKYSPLIIRRHAEGRTNAEVELDARAELIGLTHAAMNAAGAARRTAAMIRARYDSEFNPVAISELAAARRNITRARHMNRDRAADYRP